MKLYFYLACCIDLKGMLNTFKMLQDKYHFLKFITTTINFFVFCVCASCSVLQNMRPVTCIIFHLHLQQPHEPLYGCRGVLYDVTCTVAYNYVCEDTFEDPCKGCKWNIMTFLGSKFILQPFLRCQLLHFKRSCISFCSFLYLH
jgi:hypothetical protein